MRLDDLAAQPSRWPYRSSPSGARLIPEIPVTIRHGETGKETHAVVDSGADLTFIPISWANELGVDLKRSTPKDARYTLGAQPVKVYEPREQLVAEIAGRDVPLKPVFGPVNDVVLGRPDVFQAFRVTFDDRAGELILDPYPEAS